MDPNANLAEQADILRILNRFDQADRTFYLSHLASLRASLTDWLNRGGFAPDWSRYPAAARYYGISVPFGGTVGQHYRFAR